MPLRREDLPADPDQLVELVLRLDADNERLRATLRFTRGAGGYFAGMVRKAERGELHLERSLWALRQAKWGKQETRRRLMH